MTREHYISRVVLATIEPIEASGFRFLSKPKSLPADALAAKILCSRHNAALSPLDAAAGRFFKAVRDFDAGFRNSVRTPKSEKRTINGADLERWCLKAAVGLIRGKAVNAVSLRPELPWLGILFGTDDWPENWGLSVSISTQMRYAFAGMGIETRISKADGSIWAAAFNVGGFELLLHFGKVGGTPAAAFRPDGIRFQRAHSSAAKFILLDWPDGARSPGLDAIRVGEYDGPPPITQ